MIRVGIVGCGRIVEIGHAPAFEELVDLFEVVAVADPSAERRNTIGDRFGVPSANRQSDWADLFTNRDVDLIDMALPHFLHRDSCVAAAASGKPLLMEKPMATSMKEADEIMDAVKNAGAPTCIIHNYLYSAASLKALGLLDSGKIGRPFLVRLERLSGSYFAGVSNYDPSWRTKASSSGGGALIDNAYHNLYSAEAFMKSPITEVYARLGTFAHDIAVEDTVVLALGHENGGLSQILVGWSAETAKHVQEIHGSDGSILFDHEDHQLTIVNKGVVSYPDIMTKEAPAIEDGGDLTDIPDPAEQIHQSFVPLFRDYAYALESGSPSPIPFEDGYRNLQVIMAAYESHRTGNRVRIQ